MPFYQPESSCPLCQRKSAFKFLKDYKSGDGTFSLYLCQLCLGQFWLPFKNPGAGWYEQGDVHNVKNGEKPREIHAYHKKLISRRGDLLRNAKTLDLGCGTGEFMAELGKRGAQVYGTDFDKDAIAIAIQNFGFKNIFNLNLEEFFKNSGLPRFDLITVFEVFEHVDNPLMILTEAKKILKENGRLVLSIPGRERPWANLSSWDYPYHHLSRWNAEAITRLLRLAGYTKIDICYIDRFHKLYELFLEILARKLKFHKASGLKNISEGKNIPANEEKSIKKLAIKIIYKTGRFAGVVALPYLMAGIFFPLNLIIFPRSGIMYIEAQK
ncbi:MAG: class I SAM-dependent methyltransferase [Patescibacteria group bacterium]|jgi:SAM-dependent methyltransferase